MIFLNVEDNPMLEFEDCKEIKTWNPMRSGQEHNHGFKICSNLFLKWDMNVIYFASYQIKKTNDVMSEKMQSKYTSCEN